MISKMNARDEADGMSCDNVPQHHPLFGVPERWSSIPNLQVRRTMWGLGVFWVGPNIMPAGLHVTVYPGTIFMANEQDIEDMADGRYVVFLKQHTKHNPPSKQDPNLKWVLDGSNVSCFTNGIGNLINSSSPANRLQTEQLPNCRYVEYEDGW